VAEYATCVRGLGLTVGFGHGACMLGLSPNASWLWDSQIRVDEHGVVTEAKFKTFGCGSAIASR
jgi:hypothetical protein